ncbi:TonB-dependent receptor [Xylophilus sp. GOD-11R]|uniref:TonB-dependent receptor n=1 Tax=Xylophilus sp. GOD-11R TaxID=3089814 RepID=UPI00298BF6AF|nr:TonB-dependent receptor [Xylophilus sp. GOD-11R]WPB58490.1 TonB-dependent receptor [Xylophilus sp. GOD-11R]
MSASFRSSAVRAAVLTFVSASAFAQTAPVTTLKEVTVTGNPLGSDAMVQPVEQLSGDALTQRLQPTLGETLDGLPGVSSTYFGPNASRPIIRGQDGDRIRVLQNGGASIDASALSFDHSVPIEPMLIDRVEVLRGPAALLYGGSAVGGVVNVIDNRIPREPLNGVGGKVQLDGATGNRSAGGSAMVEGGNDRFALHVDAFDRHTGDVRVPVSLDCEKPGKVGIRRRICNSESQTHGGAVGGTMFFDRGYLGASVSTYRSTYGTVAEDDVTIGMRSDRYALEGEYRINALGLESIRMKASHTDYRHTEYEGGEPGTTFSNRGNELRLEARHLPMGRLNGLVGLQVESNRFSAVGEEAFAPYSRTQSAALFIHEELPTSWGKLNFGARTEHVEVESLGNAAIDRFATGKFNFNPYSAGVGALVDLSPAWKLTSNLAYTRRAPKDYELFANGPHIATAAWETGDTALKVEKSTSFDLGTEWKSGPNRFKATAYVSNFSHYIGLSRTGDVLSEEGERNPSDPLLETLPEYRYSSIRARFYGIESSGTVRLAGEQGLTGPLAGGTLDLMLRADLTRATNRDTDQPLPRIAPVRAGATLAWANGPWRLSGGFDHLASQDRVPEGDRATKAYTLWNAALGWRTQAQFGALKTSLLWFARLDNITDKRAYSATSILTTTAYPRAPLPGRSLKLGVQASF